ncbi:SPX-domain-containing protein [Marasmius fiardii PR-910]|nr:SPX-domain-containing protein [Marasmius fiardii PR-910]
MKFARYLEDTQIPEWKRAYIDYRGLKKHISKIRHGQARVNAASPSDSMSHRSTGSNKFKAGAPPPIEESQSDTPLQTTAKATASTRLWPHKKQSGKRRLSLSRASSEFSTEPMPLNVLLKRLSSEEREFFDFLDSQLEKIEEFFISRQKELQSRTATLEQQLYELRQHNETFREAQVERAKMWLRLKKDPIAVIAPSPLRKGKARASKELPPSPINREFDPEMLHNYRVLNMTGFRKALKKYEKVTRIPAQRPYMSEKVETTMFASDKSLRIMMDEMPLATRSVPWCIFVEKAHTKPTISAHSAPG